jgi:hypothetical protein
MCKRLRIVPSRRDLIAGMLKPPVQKVILLPFEGHSGFPKRLENGRRRQRRRLRRRLYRSLGEAKILTLASFSFSWRWYFEPQAPCLLNGLYCNFMCVTYAYGMGVTWDQKGASHDALSTFQRVSSHNRTSATAANSLLGQWKEMDHYWDQSRLMLF